MATTHSAPIDLYEESREDFTEEQDHREERGATEARRPIRNGDRDEPAIDAGQGRLDRVL